MQKMNVTYKGIDGADIEATHYFNLSELDVTDIMTEKPDLLKPSRLRELAARSAAAAASDNLEERAAVQMEMAYFIKDLIVLAHGTRVGSEFYHIPEKTLEFKRGLACNAVVQEVLKSEEALATFIMNVLPEAMRSAFAEGAK